ncbi:MAG: patatin-like phospholipase family protein [Nitrospirota bacterium]|nr:patatin-like phospholipase family protein [Nitrospirota bacterium]
MPDTPGPPPTSNARPRRAPGAQIALVLAGGGIPGWMYEVGVLTALDEFFEAGLSSTTFDFYVGTSAGSAVAALVANGVTPREIYDAVAGDGASPYNFTRKDIYSFGTGETWPMVKKAAASLWDAGGEVIRCAWRREGIPSLLDMVAAVQQSLPSGLFTLEPLELTLRNRFATGEGMTDDFRELRRPLYVPALNLDTGRYVVFGGEGTNHVPISRAVVASSAVPVLFQPVTIDGADYIDGGTGRVANMNVAVDQGAGLVLVINPVVHLENDRESVCVPVCHGLCKGIKQKGMAFVADQAMRINTSMRLRHAKSRQEAMFPGIDITIIEPDPKDTVMFTQNVMGHDTRLDVLRYGYRSTVAHLAANFDRYKALFSKRGVTVGLERFRWRPKSGGMRVLGPNEREKVGRGLPVSAG